MPAPQPPSEQQQRQKLIPTQTNPSSQHWKRACQAYFLIIVLTDSQRGSGPEALSRAESSVITSGGITKGCLERLATPETADRRQSMIHTHTPFISLAIFGKLPPLTRLQPPCKRRASTGSRGTFPQGVTGKPQGKARSKTNLQFRPLQLPLRALHLEPRPFMLDEVQYSRDRVLHPLRGFL